MLTFKWHLNVDIFGNFIRKNFNYCLKKGKFPCVLKHADVIPVHKKEIKSDKVNYRPVITVLNLSKICEKSIYQQLYEHFNSILSPKLCGFWKGYSAQHCLMVMLEKFKDTRDKGEEFGAFFTELSKSFDYIDQNLLITKLSWYGVTPISLKLMFSYLSSRIQDVRINNSYSRKSEINCGVSQDLVLGTLLFHTDLIDLFLNVRMITLVAMLMTLPHIPVHKICHL